MDKDELIEIIGKRDIDIYKLREENKNLREKIEHIEKYNEKLLKNSNRAISYILLNDKFTWYPGSIYLKTLIEILGDIDGI